MMADSELREDPKEPTPALVSVGAYQPMAPVSELHAAAQRYARDGLHIFPLTVGSKVPRPGSAGWKDATDDLEQIDDWWAAAPDSNIGWALDLDGKCAVDIDGAIGMAAWLSITAERPATLRASTPSGGEHWIYEGRLPPSVGKVGSKIDTRGEGSYIVLAPSIVNGVPYRWQNQSEFEICEELPSVPDWVIERCKPAGQFQALTSKTNEFDTPAQIAEAKALVARDLEKNGPPVDGEGSDQRTLLLAFNLKDLGISQTTSVDLLHQQWAPDFDRTWIEKKVSNAWKYGKSQPGSKPVRSVTDVPRRVIRLSGAELPSNLDEIEQALIEQSAPIYQRNGQLVRPAPTVLEVRDGEKIIDNNVLRPLDATALIEPITAAADLQKWNERSKD